MLIGALCAEAPESALFLGLGAGTLTQACLKFLPLEDVEAIELRPDVPRLAIEYLGLDDDPRLYIRIGDALELLDSAESADLIFVDLYNDLGPATGHLAWTFLESCQKKLSPTAGSSSINGPPMTASRWALPCCAACITAIIGSCQLKRVMSF